MNQNWETRLRQNSGRLKINLGQVELEDTMIQTSP